MEFLKKIYPLVILFCINILVHLPWLNIHKIITHGDWAYFSSQTLLMRTHQFGTWLTDINMGRAVFDLVQSPFWASFGYLYKFFGFDFTISNHILVLYPIIFLAPIFVFIFLRILFKNNMAILLAGCVYLFNSYFLTLQTGHLTLALAYTFVPLLLYFLIIYVESKSSSIFFSLLITTLLVSILEFRFGVICIGLAIVYFLMNKKYYDLFFYILITILLQSYWLFPAFFSKFLYSNNILSRDLFGTNFFGTISSLFLHHPFWSYGKAVAFVVNSPSVVYLVVAIPFIVMLMNFKNVNINLKFFIIIGFIGIFLSKQNNPPFGYVYEFLYQRFPLFSMYREATKFYLLTSLAFSVSAGYFYEKIKNLNTRYLFVFAFIIYQTVVFIPFINGKVGSTFGNFEIPYEYVEYNKFIQEEQDFYRVLWLPKVPRWVSFSENQQNIGVADLAFSTWLSMYKFGEPVHMDLSRFIFRKSDQELANMEIRYILVPKEDKFNDDNFFSDYGFQKELYIKNLTKRFGEPIIFGELYIYVMPWDNLQKIYSDTFDVKLTSQNLNKYCFDFLKNDDKHSKIVFSESFHPDWILYPASEFSWWKAPFLKPIADRNHYMEYGYANAWNIPSSELERAADKNGEVKLVLYFLPQTYFYYGLIVSLTTFFSLVGYLVFSWFKNRKTKDIKIDKTV